MRCFLNYRDTRRGVYYPKHRGIRTLSKTAYVNLDTAFVENALFFTVKSQQNRIELVASGRPEVDVWQQDAVFALSPADGGVLVSGGAVDWAEGWVEDNSGSAVGRHHCRRQRGAGGGGRGC